MQFRAHTRFHGVRDHQIRFALDQRVENRGCRSIWTIVAFCRSARSKRSLVPPGLTITCALPVAREEGRGQVGSRRSRLTSEASANGLERAATDQRRKAEALRHRIARHSLGLRRRSPVSCEAILRIGRLEERGRR
jgi:hypothetical protein